MAKPVTWAKIDRRKIIPGDKLQNEIGDVYLSEEGMKGLNLAQKFYHGESKSYVIDRVLRRVNIQKVYLPLSLTAQTFTFLNEESKKRGYTRVEDLVEATLERLKDGQS